MDDTHHGSKEAFCLMWYASHDGSVRERIWNARDGVTPFCITSRDHQVGMEHVDYDRDEYGPAHVPGIGDRIFVDLSMEQALEQRRVYVEQHWDTGEDKLSALYADKEAAIHKLATNDYERFYPSPTLITVTPEILSVINTMRRTIASALAWDAGFSQRLRRALLRR